MIDTDNNLLGAAAAFAAGGLLSFINYKLTCFCIKKFPSFFSYVSVVRIAILALYLVLLFFIAPHTPWDKTYILLGGATGATIPMFFFTVLLLKKDKAADGQKNSKEVNDNG